MSASLTSSDYPLVNVEHTDDEWTILDSFNSIGCIAFDEGGDAMPTDVISCRNRDSVFAHLATTLEGMNI